MRLSHWLQLLGHPYALLLYTVTFWSGNMVIGRAFRDAIPPIQLATARWVVALFLCLPFALPHWRNHWPRIKAAWPLFTLLGLLGVGGYNTFAYLALQSTSAINAALLNTFIPIATMLLATLLVGEKLTARQGAGIALAAIGALVVITHGEPQQLLALTFNRGDLWMVMAVLSWALYTVLLRRRSPGVDPLVQLTFFIVVGLVILLPFAGWERFVTEQRVQVSWSVLLAILYTGIFPGFLGYIFYNAAVAKVGAGVGSLFLYAMPVLTALLSLLFLEEAPHLYHLVGLVLVFAGIGVTLRRS